MAEGLTRTDVANQLKGSPLDKAKGVGNVLYEFVVGGRIDDYESPGEKLGAGIESFLKSVPNRVQSFVESPVESTRQAVVNLDSYLEDLYSRVSSEDPMAAMEAAQFAMTGGVGVALAKGYKVGELLDYDPNVAKIFIGPVGADNLADAGQPTAKKVLNIAKVMKLQGASSDEIRNATNKVIEREDPSLGGVSTNAAGAFVVELDDSKMDLRSEKAIRSATGGMQTPSGGMYFPAGVEKVLKGDQFSKAYPNEGSLQILTEAEAPRRGVRGTADPETGRVQTFVERPRVVNVTAHELQHLAQFIENFPVGGNFEEAAEGLFGPVARDFAEISILLERYDGEIPDWEFEKPKFGDTGFANPKEAKKTAQQLLDEADGDADLASEAAMMQGDEILNSPDFYLSQLYQAVSGEVEARNVQTRLSMTAAERRATRPEDTEDIPRDQQVVVRGDGMVFNEGDDFVNFGKQKLKQQQLRNIIIDGKADGESVEAINKKVVDAATRLKVPYPQRAFEDPKVEYVDTQTIADNVAQYNYPRYDVGTFGGDFESGDMGNMPGYLAEFQASGKETLKENIFNEGIKEPIEIEVTLKDGGISIGQGHHRLQAALELGMPKIPVVVRTEVNPRFDPKVRPATIDTSGLKKFKTYSFSELGLEQRIKTPKETPEEIRARGGALFEDYETGALSDRRFPQYTTPMREGFFRVVDEKADGGEMRKGVGSLSEIARRMNEGGPSSIDDEINAIVPSVIMAESSNDPKAVSEDGAIGLMQVLPSTAMKPGYGLPTIFELAREQGFVVDEETPEMAEQLLFMPELNVEFGSRYLKAMRKEYDTMEDALRAYNAGPGNFNDYLAKGRDLSALDDEAVQYPLRVAAAGQGINPNEPAQYEAFTDSPAAFSTFMNTASEERPPRPNPRARPPVTYDGPRPMPRPTMPQDAPQQQMIPQAFASVAQPQSLQQKYSPQGIEQMLTGTIGEPLLPRQFQQGSPYSSMR